MRETTKGSYVEFIGYQMLQHEQNGCTVLFTRLQSTIFFQYSDWWLRYWPS